MRADHRVAVGHQRHRQLASRIGPAHHVGEAQVPERLVGVRAVQAHRLGAEHVAAPEPDRQAEGVIELVIRALHTGPSDRLLGHDLSAVERATLTEQVHEAGELVRRGHHVAGWHDARQESRVAANDDQLFDRHTERAGQ